MRKKPYSLSEHLLTSWIEALKSDRYEQTSGVLMETLSNRPCYCALGVVCAELGVKDNYLETNGLVNANIIKQCPDLNVLNGNRKGRYELWNVIAALNDEGITSSHYEGLKNRYPTIKINKLLLDKGGLSFEQIAEFLKDNVKII